MDKDPGQQQQQMIISRLLLCFFLVASKAPFHSTQSFASAMASLPPLPNLPVSTTNLLSSHSFSGSAHWVIPGLLMQGERPEVDQISKIVKEGKCQTFVCLQAECLPEEDAILLDDGGVHDWKCDPMELPTYSDEAKAVANEVCRPSPVLLHYGILDMNTAKKIEGLERVVSDLADRVRSGETIYLHCLGGKGRAGLVVSCLLLALYRDIDAETALEYIQMFVQMRNIDGDGSKFYHSPETDEQKKQVEQYYERMISFGKFMGSIV